MKYTILFFSILLFNQTLSSQNSFTAKLEVPKEMVQGEYSEISLKIYKPKGARNYTVFSQKLPVGFFVKMKEAVGATYSYENNVLTLTWLRCPAEDVFTVKYEIASMVGISGSFNLGGKLTYMAGAEQAIFNLKSKKFTLFKEINKVNTINPVLKKTKNNFTPHISTKLKGVICKREVVFNKKKNYYEVELKLVSNKKGAYSIIEIIPKGFIFLEIDLHGAKIRKQSNLVQYMWKNTSFDEGIKIKYQLIPKENNKNKPSLSGKLSFLKDGKIYNMPILEENN